MRDPKDVLRPGVLLALAVCAAAATTACSNEDSGSTADTVVDTGGAADTYAPPDTFVPLDVTPSDTGQDDDTGANPGDTAGGDTDAEPDTSGPCDTTGCPCASNADCLDELCLETADGLRCSETCITECSQPGFACLPITLGGSDPFNACVPMHPHLCKPCRDNTDCRNALVPAATSLCVPAAEPGDGSFCASSCESIACPDGYSCQDVPLAAGGSAKQCVPSDGACACRPSWASLGLSTDCAVSGDAGTCHGTRTCGADGLTACDAATPAGELCDLVDNDCDGDTDDGTCDDSLPCTDDSCVGVDDCDHDLRGGYCVIDDQCVTEGTANPGASCQACVPSASTTSWTDAAGGDACFIDSVCYPSGTPKPGAPCFECRPSLSTAQWSPVPAEEAKACDDGQLCTHGDSCSAGSCVGTPYACSDGLACTDDVCTGVANGCDYPIHDDACLIGGTCYAARGRADAGGCQACDPATSQTAWSSAPADWALACDDDNPCSLTDTCGAGGCAGVVEDDCDDGLACTADSCNGDGSCSNTLTGGCLIDGACYVDGATVDGNPCQVCDTSVSTAQWTKLHLVTPEGGCDDGDLCTTDEYCNQGACTSDQRDDCDDDDACTTDVCNGDGTCTNTPIADPIELCDDGIDNDCDGITDEGEVEACGDLVDNDCDGDTDESGDTWGEVFFARAWQATYGWTTAIYTNVEGTNDFEAEKVIAFPGTPAYTGTAGVGDFDGDGFRDLIIVRPDAPHRSSCTSSSQCGSGETCRWNLCLPQCSSNDTSCATPGVPASADDRCVEYRQYGANADTRLCSPPLHVYLARERCPDGAVEELELAKLEAGAFVGPIVDADNNGHLDLVIRRQYWADHGYTLLNDGDFGFTKVEPGIDMSGYSCSWVWNVSPTSKDLNGDGVVDLLGYCNPNGGDTPAYIWWWEGHGDGAFGPPVQLASRPVGPASLIAASDFDRDGDNDVISGLDDDGDGGQVSMMLNRGSSAADSFVPGYEIFDVAPSYTSANSADTPGVGNGVAADFNRDGWPDIVSVYVPEEGCSGSGCALRDLAIITNRTASPCGAGMTCDSNACVACSPHCGGRVCGSDGCGGACGSCERGEVCEAMSGQCLPRNECVPQCGTKTCGDNGCGGVCGYCGEGESCVGGSCQTGCVPSCAGKACGGDGCGGTCAVFGDVTVLTHGTQRGGVVAPSNAPPTAPTIKVLPTNPGSGDDLRCLTQTPSYDLDPVRLEYRWYKNGAYAKDVGDRLLVPSALTGTGQEWRCEVRATDGIEWSPFADPDTPGANVVYVQ